MLLNVYVVLPPALGTDQEASESLPRRAARTPKRRLRVAEVKHQPTSPTAAFLPSSCTKCLKRPFHRTYRVNTVHSNSSTSFHRVKSTGGFLTRRIIWRWLMGEGVVQHVSKLGGIRERGVPTGVQHVADYPARVIPAL